LHFIDLFHDWLHEVESPLNFQTATALFTISAAVERKVWVNWGVDSIYPNVYLILVGPPGTKKSVIRRANQLLRGLEVNLMPDKATLRAMWNAMEAKHKVIQIDGKDIRHCSWGLISEEWQFFIGDQDKEFLNNLNKLFDCRDKFDYITATQDEVHLKNVYFTMIGAIQPDILASTLPKEAIGSGTTSRIIYVVCNRERLKRAFPIINPLMEEQLLKQVALINAAQGEMHFDNETKKLLINWYENGEFEKSSLRQHPYFTSYIDRIPTHVVKLAMLMSLARSSGKGEIDYIIKKVDWHRGLKWLVKLEQHMAEAYGAYGLNKLAYAISRVQKYIQAKKSCLLSEVCGEFWQDVSYRDTQEVVRSLLAMQKIQVETTVKGEMLHWIGGHEK
jgi:hypothetical protein